MSPNFAGLDKAEALGYVSRQLLCGPGRVLLSDQIDDDVKDLAAIQELFAAARHQDCLQACQNILQANQSETYAYKYAGKSLIALGQFEKAKQCLIKAHQLDGDDPEIVKDIGNIFNALKKDAEAVKLYEAALLLTLTTHQQATIWVYCQAARQSCCRRAAGQESLWSGSIIRNLSMNWEDLQRSRAAWSSPCNNTKSLELNPNNPDAYISLGGSTKILGSLIKPLQQHSSP